MFLQREFLLHSSFLLNFPKIFKKCVREHSRNLVTCTRICILIKIICVWNILAYTSNTSFSLSFSVCFVLLYHLFLQWCRKKVIRHLHVRTSAYMSVFYKHTKLTILPSEDLLHGNKIFRNKMLRISQVPHASLAETGEH